MKITLFTSNQPRHCALIERLSLMAETLFVVQETTTLRPGVVSDYYRKSSIMEAYFSRVVDAEQRIFGHPRFTPWFGRQSNVQTLSLSLGDLSTLKLAHLEPALSADQFVVFGSSYIRGPLCEELVKRRAINIHMGCSPQYRGSSCNFWPLHDNKADLVGATIHLLTSGLDSGPILFHSFPRPQEVDGFQLGMEAVKVAQQAVCELITTDTLYDGEPVAQDREKQVRYSRGSDFTDEIASEYLQNEPKPASIIDQMASRDVDSFVRPIVI